MRLLRECTPIFLALGDINRQNILVMLYDQPLTVNEITKNLSLSRPAVSHHLKLLLDSKLLEVEQKGKERYYSVALQASLILLNKLLNTFEQSD
jgi:ArsR family transcriptional regulator